MKFYYVYILKCSDGSFYTGITSRLDTRVQEHNYGKYKNAYTYLRRPVELVFYETFTVVEQAIYFEKKLKGWSRTKKEALIQGDFDRLKYLAECRNASHFKYRLDDDSDLRLEEE